MPEDAMRWSREISALAITATSPDKCVEVDIEGGRKIQIRITPGSFDNHTVQSLSTVINHTIEASMAAFQHGCAQLEREIFGRDI